MKAYFNLLFLVLTFFIVSCGPTRGDFKQVEVQQIYTIQNQKPETLKENRRQLESKINSLLLAVINKDSKKILEQINPKTGAYIDLKALSPYTEIEKDLKNLSGLLNPILFDGKRLRAKHKDEELKSIHELLFTQDQVLVEMHFNTSEQCEIELHITPQPPKGVLGNPIYIKENGSWYLFQIF